MPNEYLSWKLWQKVKLYFCISIMCLLQKKYSIRVHLLAPLPVNNSLTCFLCCLLEQKMTMMTLKLNLVTVMTTQSAMLCGPAQICFLTGKIFHFYDFLPLIYII